MLEIRFIQQIIMSIFILWYTCTYRRYQILSRQTVMYTCHFISFILIKIDFLLEICLLLPLSFLFLFHFIPFFFFFAFMRIKNCVCLSNCLKRILYFLIFIVRLLFRFVQSVVVVVKIYYAIFILFRLTAKE